ncbi:MAG: discoidin domain-containing protein [Pirellulales bacterium]|nr:discoidin domain-containing protein [Pirellulales bacterium]
MSRAGYLSKFFTFALGLAVLGLAAGAMAQTNWTGTVSSNWSDSGNWDAGVPIDGVVAYIDSAVNNPTLDADGAAQEVRLGGSVGAAHLTVDDNTLAVTGHIFLGQATGTTSTITQSGGDISCNMLYGGSTVAGQSGSGQYTMTGGTLTVGILAFGNQGSMEFTQTGGVVNNWCGMWLGDGGYPGSVSSTLGGPGSATYTLSNYAVYNGAVNDTSHLAPWGGYGELTLEDYAVFTNHNVTVDLASSTVAATGIINVHGNAQMTLTGTLTLASSSVTTGTVNQDGGVVSIKTIDKGLGAGTYNLTGGTLSVSKVDNMDLVNGGGRVNVGGTGVVSSLSMGLSGPVLNNIALGKTATASSYWWPPENAVDGDYNNFFHTANSEEDAWWKVDLTGDDTNTSIHDIVLTARYDGYTYSLTNFFVRVLDKDGVTVVWQDKFIEDISEQLGAGEDLVITLPTAVDGRYVQVQIDGLNLGAGTGYEQTLTLTEVAVGDITRYGYSQTAASTLGVELDPANELCDKMVAGAVTLAGTLDVTSLGGDFADGQVFDILDWTSLTGTFDAVNLPTLTGGLSWDVSNLYTTGELTVVPEPSTLVLVIMGMIGLLAAGRRR